MILRALALTVVALSIQTGAQASLKSEIEALNGPISDAFKNRDISGFKKVVRNHMTSDFVYTEGDTTMNFDQMIGRFRQEFSSYAKISHASIRVVSVKENRAQATVLERHYLDGIAKSPEGKPHKSSFFVGLSTETFRKDHGQWKMATMSMRPEAMTMDGKPQPLGGPKVR